MRLLGKDREPCEGETGAVGRGSPHQSSRDPAAPRRGQRRSLRSAPVPSRPSIPPPPAGAAGAAAAPAAPRPHRRCPAASPAPRQPPARSCLRGKPEPRAGAAVSGRRGAVGRRLPGAGLAGGVRLPRGRLPQVHARRGRPQPTRSRFWDIRVFLFLLPQACFKLSVKIDTRQGVKAAATSPPFPLEGVHAPQVWGWGCSACWASLTDVWFGNEFCFNVFRQY